MATPEDWPTGWRLVSHDVLGSTNTEARWLARAGGAGTGAVVIRAGVQTDGRGRGTRTWHSPADNLYFSVLLQPQVPKAHLALASLVASVAVVEGMEDVAPALAGRLSCKWPNDVLCAGRKLCGILLEGEVAQPAWIVIGIGINIVWMPDTAAVRCPATSLAAEGSTVSAEEVFRAVCHRLAMWLDRWQREGFAPVRKAWLARAAGMGESVRVRFDEEDAADFSGILAGLDEDGALLLEEGKGRPRRILAGDILF